MICLLLLRLVSGVPFFKYEDMLYDLEVAASSEKVEKLELGSTIDGNKVSVLKINSDSTYNCLVVGGIYANEQSSTLQVMEDIQQSLRRQKVLDINLWFIPILNPDGYLRIQDHFLKHGSILEIYKNRRDTQCINDIDIGVDLNRNFADGPYSECDHKYQGEYAFSEPETQIILDLLQSQDFQLVITYLAGDFHYVVPESYPPNKALPFIHQKFPGSLAEYASSKGIFSLIGFVGEDNRPRDFQYLDRNVEVFFEFLNRVKDAFYTTSEHRIEGNDFVLFISVQNKGIYESGDCFLVVQSSQLVGKVKARIEYEDSAEEFEEVGENFTWELTLKNMKVNGLAKIKFHLENIESENIQVSFAIQQAPAHKDVKSASIGVFDYFFIGTIAFLSAAVLVFCLSSCLKNEEEDDKRVVNIPARPLPWEFL